MTTKSKIRKPGIRVDGANRRDLNRQRVASRMAELPAQAPTPEQAAERKHRADKRAKDERRAAARGHDGAVVTSLKLRVSGLRKTLQSVRCRPGSFEWRYGRRKHGSEFDAGSQFAQLWERAGATVASSANFLRGTTSGYETGLSEGRAIAMQKLQTIVRELGKASTERLIAYCVKGETSSEIAARYGVRERDMGAVLALDLLACAQAMRFTA